MKTIIDGYKYDTDTADSLLYKTYKAADGSDCHVVLYRNIKGAFFSYEYVVSQAGGEISSEIIIPKSKDDIKKYLIAINEVDLYEDIFGIVDEAPADDDVDIDDSYYADREEGVTAAYPDTPDNAVSTTNTEVAELNDIIATSDSQDILMSDESKLIPSLTLNVWIGRNNIDKTSSAIVKGAKVTKKSISMAIVTQNVALVTLVAKANPSAIDDKHYKLALAHHHNIYAALCNIDKPSKACLLRHQKIAHRNGANKTEDFIKELLKNEE